MKQKITKNILLLEIVERYPKLVDVLVEKYGLHCLGCGMSAIETLAEGAMGHGMTNKDIEEMIAELNTLANKVDAVQKKK